jgi:Ca2+-binding EF-hand superfamily protein
VATEVLGSDRVMSAAKYVNDVIESLRHNLAKRGYGLLHLRREFIEADVDGSGYVSWDEFQNLLKRVKLNPSQNDMRILFHHLDKDNRNSISAAEFIAVMRDDLSAYRRNIIRIVFDKIDTDNDGVISISDIGKQVSFLNHPDVKGGKISCITFMIDFLDTLNNISDRGQFSFPEWLEYYGSIAAYDTEESFEEAMNAMWGLKKSESKLKARSRRSNRRNPAIDEAAALEQKISEMPPVPPDGMSETLFRVAHQGPNPDKLPTPARVAEDSKLPLGIAQIVSKFREELHKHGGTGFVAVQRKFRIADDDGNKQLDFSEFKKACLETGMDLDKDELMALFRYFDKDHSNSIDFEELLQGVRAPMNTRRVALVHMAFDRLDSDGNGVIDGDEVAECYDASRHPEVISGRKTEEDVLRDFLTTFDVGGEIDGKVTREEFTNYYHNISASIDNDDYFELMIRNAWHISGGEGAAANSANRRVLVTHADGRQTVEEIRNDLGLRADDRAAMIARLRAQGVDVVAIDTKGGSSAESAGAGSGKAQSDKKRGSQTQSLEALQEQRSQPPAEKPAESGIHPSMLDPTLKPAEARRQLGSTHISRLHIPLGLQNVLERLRVILKERGAHGYIGLQRKFKSMDTDGSRSLDIQEFRSGMMELNLRLDAADYRALFDYFDKDQSGSIDFNEFIIGLRDKLNPRRYALVQSAFSRLDADGSGAVDGTEIAKFYDASRHPDVLSGKRSPESIMDEFLSTFDVGGEKDGCVTRREFVNYYSNVSASIDNDDYFELMIRNAWHISGGEGAAANSANRRVLVTHADGRQTVEEIRNDLGLRADDKEGMIARLRSQGINPKSIDVLGGTDDDGEDVMKPVMETVTQRHKAGLSSRKIHERGRETTSTLPGSGRLIFKDGKYLDTGGAALDDHRVVVRNDTLARPDVNARRILADLKDEFQARGVRGLVGLQRKMRNLGAKSLSRTGMKDMLQSLSISLEDSDFRILFDHLDASSVGAVGFRTFLEAVRRPLNDRRLDLVKKAFVHIGRNVADWGTDLSKPITHMNAEKAAMQYDASRHPDVLNKVMLEEDQVKEFLETMDIGQEVEGQISMDEWIDYHTNVSCTILNDDSFEETMRGVWHFTKEDEIEEFRKSNKIKGRLDPSEAGSGRIAGAPTREYGKMYARRHNSSAMVDAIGLDLSPAPDPKEMATLHRKQLLQRTHASSKVRDAMALGDLSDPAREEIKVAPLRRKLLETTHNSSQMFTTMFLQEKERVDGTSPVQGERRKRKMQDKPAALQPRRLSPEIKVLVAKLQHKLAQRGVLGFVGLQRVFRNMDDDGNRLIDLDEFTKGMREIGVGLSLAQIETLFRFFDRDQSGNIDFNEFLVGVREPLNKRRLGLVHLAFDLLDKDGNGAIDPDEVISLYNASKHPDVVAGRKTEEDVMAEFLHTFDVGGEVDGKVTKQEFENYYSNISASIDNDDYFELMIRNVWHISGGQGQAANSANRRVLVTHTDGRQTVEEIQNDLGLRPDDKQHMLSQLKKQGVDATKVELFG